MKALIVCSVRTPGIDELIARIAPTFGLSIAADGGAAALLAAGVTPDLVVGDFDSLADDVAVRLRGAGVRFETHSRDKDVTDLDLALDAARAMGASEVTVAGATGGRLDLTLATVGSLLASMDLSPALVDPGLHGWLLGAADVPVLELRGVGACVSVQALTESAAATSSGLRWPLDGVRLSLLGSTGVSNVIVSERAVVRVTHGRVLVTSSEDASDAPLAIAADG